MLACVASSMSRLIDKIRLEVRAGRGGDGIVAYAAHKLKRLVGPGQPSGGNGGRGGDVSIIAKLHIRSLSHVKNVVLADHGGNGKRDRENGSPGSHAVIQVPVGVTVVDATSGALLADLDCADDAVIVGNGGAGGRGNNRARPHESTVGEPGESRKLILELKTIADIGLVGFPNAGKSSILRFISRATPEVAAYPFTTLAPYVGIADTAAGAVAVADIPGLVEDAHLNRGMGHEFLRHIERTKALLFVIDSTRQHWNPQIGDKMGSVESLVVLLRKEIEMYDAALAVKPWGVVLNKIDPDVDSDIASRLQAGDALELKLRKNEPQFKGLVAVSAKYGIGRSGLVQLLERLVPQQR